jgi:hypothetical protein
VGQRHPILRLQCHHQDAIADYVSVVLVAAVFVLSPLLLILLRYRIPVVVVVVVLLLVLFVVESVENVVSVAVLLLPPRILLRPVVVVVVVSVDEVVLLLRSLDRMHVVAVVVHPRGDGQCMTVHHHCSQVACLNVDAHPLDIAFLPLSLDVFFFFKKNLIFILSLHEEMEINQIAVPTGNGYSGVS